MDREKEELILDIPEAEMLDFWEEGSEYIMYDKWDRIKDWLRRIFRFQNGKKIWRFFGRGTGLFDTPGCVVTKGTPYPPKTNNRSSNLVGSHKNICSHEQEFDLQEKQNKII